MKKIFTYLIMLSLVLLIAASGSFANSISASSYKAGDVVEIKGKIEPGQDLYLAVAQTEMFAPKDTKGAFEIKRLKKDGKKFGSLKYFCIFTISKTNNYDKFRNFNTSSKLQR